MRLAVLETKPWIWINESPEVCWSSVSQGQFGGVRLTAINNVAAKPLGLSFAVASYWCKTAAEIQNPSPVTQLSCFPCLASRPSPASSFKQEPFPVIFEVSWPCDCWNWNKRKGEGQEDRAVPFWWQLWSWRQVSLAAPHPHALLLPRLVIFPRVLWCYSSTKGGLWWINPLAANWVSIRKISGKINICLVAVQLFSVANPNKYLFEGVHFHADNQQTKTCVCEADGWVLWMICACTGCCVEWWNCFKEEQESVTWVSWMFPWPVWFLLAGTSANPEKLL